MSIALNEAGQTEYESGVMDTINMIAAEFDRQSRAWKRVSWIHRIIFFGSRNHEAMESARVVASFASRSCTWQLISNREQTQ